MTKHGILADEYPELLDEWDFEKNKDICSPYEVTSGSNKKVWWICGKGHSFDSKICFRALKQCGCPICSGHRVLLGYNDLQTTNPEIAKDWHPTKNKNLTPTDVMPQSNKKVWWLGSCGHEYSAYIYHRTQVHSGCPICANEMKTSFAQEAVYYYIKQYYIDAINRYTDLGKELDIYIPSLGVAIEYDGQFYHKNLNKDKTKNKWCLLHNIRLIRIREQNCPTIAGCDVIIRNGTNDASLTGAIKLLLTLLNTFNIDVDVDRDRALIMDQYIITKKENSIATNYPLLVKEWHSIKNKNLIPSMFTKGSSIKIWWKCSKCDYEWKAQINSRTRGSGCPRCAGELGYKLLCVETGKIFNSLAEACTFCNGLKSNIVACANGRRKSAYGYHWEYVKED